MRWPHGQQGAGAPGAGGPTETLARHERSLRAAIAVQRTLLEGLPEAEQTTRVLQLLGEAAEASRAYLFEVHPGPDGRPLVSQRAEWCAPGVRSELDNPGLQALDLAGALPRWWARMGEGSTCAAVVAELPEEERPLLEAQGIASILILPMRVGGRLEGFLGFDDCTLPRRWDAQSVDLLELAAASLCLERERRHTEQRRAQEEQQRRQAERARDQREADLRALIEQLPVAIGITSGRSLAYINPAGARLLGARAPADVEERPLGELLPAEDLEQLIHRLSQASGQPTAMLGPVQLRRMDGQTRLTDVTVVPTSFRGESALAWIARDITAERQVQEQLLLADRLTALGTLAAGMAHEINNPLTYVLSNLEFAEEGLARAGLSGRALGSCTQALAEAREGAERVRRVVRQLKLFSRPEEERLGPVDPLAALEMAAAMAANEIRHRARLRWERGRVPWVLADEARLGQVLLNLVVNAAQAIPEGQAEQHEICLSTALAPDGRVVLAVRDSGQGIAREVLPRIFDPFFTTKPQGVGTGLGLPISHSLVRSMGGEMQVESTPGRGTVFRVLLPAATGTAAPTPSPAPPPRPPRQRVLVVDDDAMVARSLARMLAGHEVEVALGGEKARARLQERQDWQLVLCDLMMPDLTGMDLYAQVERAWPTLASRFVFMTGGAFTERARVFVEQMEGRVLYKPFGESHLRQLLERQQAA